MNLQEAGKLLLVASGFDRREVSELNATAWHTALGKHSYEDCEKAVIAHFTDPLTRHEYLTVGHVLDRVEAQGRMSKRAIEADVRSAKARGLIDRSYPARERLPEGVARRLAEARRRDMEQVRELES